MSSHTSGPHPERLTDGQAFTQLNELLEQGTGTVEFSMRENIVKVERLAFIPDPGYILFSVSVNGISLEDFTFYKTDDNEIGYALSIPQPLWGEIGSKVAIGKNPFNTLHKVIGHPSFLTYLADSVRYSAAIKNESARFRDVLVRKYRQLTYRDEYESLEMTRFREEVERFAQKRLPEVPSQWAVDSVVRLVSGWVSEQDTHPVSAEFDPSMSPTDYERFCADRFAVLGWKVRLTKGSGDQGADIVCEANGQRLVVQCKLYSAPVGNGAVQEVIAAREFEFAHSTAVVTNASYTPAARSLASTAGVHLLHHDEIYNIKPE